VQFHVVLGQALAAPSPDSLLRIRKLFQFFIYVCSSSVTSINVYVRNVTLVMLISLAMQN
jgi:hypothetical protein